jgi:N-acetylmuramoyl-L-alanine amidase
MKRRLWVLLGLVSFVFPACVIDDGGASRSTAVRSVAATAAPPVAPTSPRQPTAPANASPQQPAASTPSTVNPTTAAIASQESETYMVQPGDTLFALSRRTGVPVTEIARANGILADSELRTGQQLRIPRPSTARPSAGSLIRVSSPESGEQVRSPIVVQGMAAVFEGVVNIEVLAADGMQLVRTSATADRPDAGQPGPFRAAVEVPGSVPQPVTLRVFWRSPRDGAPMDEVRIPLTLVG